MSIQSNINQGLSLAALLATQNPSLQAIAKKRQEVSSLTKQKEYLGKATSLMAESGEPEIAQSYADKMTEVSKQIFETDPTKATAKSYLEDRSRSTAEKKAQDMLKNKQEEKRKTRRNFLDYMKDEPTSLGATFGELAPALQKKIASQYSKSARKKIMDRKDASNG